MAEVVHIALVVMVVSVAARVTGVSIDSASVLVVGKTQIVVLSGSVVFVGEALVFVVVDVLVTVLCFVCWW